MYAYLKRCVSDEDFAQFTLFFIRHRSDFHSQFSLQDTLKRLLETIDRSRIVLAYDRANRVIAWINYWYVSEDLEPEPEGKIAFVDSVLVDKEHRSTRVFFEGFREVMQQIAEENSRVQSVRFCAQADNVYVNRLYSKFARMIGQQEGYYGWDNIYSSDFRQLLHSLNQTKKGRKV